MIRWRFYDQPAMRDLLEHVIQAAATPVTGARAGRGEPMPINVYQTAAEVVVEAALPGVRPEDIELNFTDGVLTLRARTTFEEHEYLHQEMQSMEFGRQISLPVDCRGEEAKADFEHGILEVRIPKQRPQPPEKIRIQVNRRGAGGTTIDASRGSGYEEVQAPSKRPSGGGAGGRKSSPGPKRGPAA